MLVLLGVLWAEMRGPVLEQHGVMRARIRDLRLGSRQLELALTEGRLPPSEKKAALAKLATQAESLRTLPTSLSDKAQQRFGDTVDDFLVTLARLELPLDLQTPPREPAEVLRHWRETGPNQATSLLLNTYLELFEERQQQRLTQSLLLLGLCVGGALGLTVLMRQDTKAARAGALTQGPASDDSHARFLQELPEGFLTVDAAGRIQDFNTTAEKMFSLPRAQAVGRDFLSLGVATSASSAQRRELKGMIQGAATLTPGAWMELLCLRADGSVFPAELSMSRLSTRGAPLLALCVRDITERKAQERTKSEFVSLVSHELRTPLTSIRGSLGLLEGGVMGELATPVVDMVRIARINTERLIRLINDVLDLEKIEAGKMDLRLQLVNVAEAIDATLAGVRGMADALHIQLRSEVLSPGMIRADRDRLIQVLTNLVSNAIKFSPPRGVVVIQALQEAGGEQLRLCVVDQGPGIPPEKQAQLFGKFQQLDSMDARSKGGTGLGLAISQAIVEQHGGRIEVRSQPGQGATFTFTLPAVKVDSGSFMMKDESRYGILTVLPDAALSAQLRGMLSGAGFRAMRASSLTEARTHLEAGTADVLVMADPLPEGQGSALVRQLRQDPLARTLSIVLLTEQAPPESARLPQVEWLLPPWDEPRLIRALRHCVRPPGPARVLLADGRLEVRQAMRALLEPCGAVCREAEDGERVVALARESPPDLLIMDVRLAVLDGFEVVDVLRQGKLRGLPLITYSQHELTLLERRQLSLGPTRHLSGENIASKALLLTARELLAGLLSEPPPGELLLLPRAQP